MKSSTPRKDQVARLTALVDRRTGELTASRRGHARETRRRESVETDLGVSERLHGDLLERALLMEERLRLLSRKLLAAQEEERMRISRDLHDAIGQTLTGINVGLAALKLEASAGSRGIADAITLTQQLVERSMKTVHQFAWELRPTLLDDLGLAPALRSYTRTFAERTGVKVRFTADATFENLDGDRRIALFRVGQGALSNVERHSRAGRASVVLRSLPGIVRLEVKDDGRSFDVQRMERSKTNKHLGLLVMRERIEMVGGRFSIDSSRKHGTTVRADVPMEATARD
jgi:signal transduction histidine kinase